MKKLMSLLLVIVLLASFMVNANAEGNVVFSINSTSAGIGEKTASLVMRIDENPGYAGADIRIVSELPLAAIQSRGVDAIYSLDHGAVNWSSDKNITKTGETLVLTFAIPDDAQAGDSWDVSMTVVTLEDAQYNPVPYVIHSGSISIKGLSSIEIASVPKKTEYIVGETVDTTGLSLTATYNDGTTGTIASGFTCMPETLMTAGTQTITVSYGGLTVSFDVEVSAETVERLAGDANKDGSVNLKDVVQIRRWLVGGWDAVIDESNADVDGNSRVNLKDAVLIRRYLADDWDVTLL